MRTRLHHTLKSRQVIYILATILLALVGTRLLLDSHAATPTASIEVESGTFAHASSVQDSTASGGQAVLFQSGTCGWQRSAPATYKHVVWIWMENKDETQVIGPAPYISNLASLCGTATNVQDSATSASLPSEPQYAAGTSGSNCNTGINTTGSGCITNDNDYGSSNSLTTTSIFQLATSSGDTWKSYQESMPTNCARTSTAPYAYKHNPAAFYSNMTADCTANDVGFPTITCNATTHTPCTTPTGSFASDIANGSLPTFSFVTPDLNNDMHDGTITQGDNWLSTYLPLIIAGPNYRAGDTAVFVMWDEGSSNSGSSSTDIPSVVIAPSIKPGTSSSVQTNNIGLLRTTQEMLGLTPYLGCASGTPPGGTGSCATGSSTSLRPSLGL